MGIKPVLVREGDNLIVKVEHEAVVDTDKDGIPAIKAKGTIEVVADGSEVLNELLKSGALAEKAKKILEKLGVIKPEAVNAEVTQ